jgi:hypothetical protein
MINRWFLAFRLRTDAVRPTPLLSSSIRLKLSMTPATWSLAEARCGAARERNIGQCARSWNLVWIADTALISRLQRETLRRHRPRGLAVTMSE